MLINTAKIKEHMKPKRRPRHTGKFWPSKRKVAEQNKENKPANKKKRSSSVNIDDDESFAKIVTNKKNSKIIRNVNARELYKAQREKMKCVTIDGNSIWINKKSTS